MEEEKKKQLFCAGLRTWGWSLASGVNKSVRVCALTLQIPQTHTGPTHAQCARLLPGAGRRTNSISRMWRQNSGRTQAHCGPRPLTQIALARASTVMKPLAFMPSAGARRTKAARKGAPNSPSLRSPSPLWLKALRRCHQKKRGPFDLGGGKTRMTDKVTNKEGGEAPIAPLSAHELQLRYKS